MTIPIHYDREQSDDVSRAILYNLFASLLVRKIDDSWLNPHFQNKLQLGLPETEGKLIFLNSLKKATLVSEALREIQLDFDGLFNVPGPKLTFPYESCYTHRNVDGTFGRLWQEPALEIQRILKDWEIEYAVGWNLIPDHIAVELFFMSELCSRSSNTQGSDQEALRDWQIKFFNNHLKNWAFEFLSTLEKKSETDLYRGVAKLLREFLLEEEEDLTTSSIN